MKILFSISHLSHTGPVHALQSIVEGFNELEGGHEVVVLTLRDPQKDILRPDFERLGVRYENISVNPFWPFATLARIRRFLVREDFYVLASNGVRADAMLGLASFRLVQRRLYTTVQNIPRDEFGFMFPGWRGRFVAWLHYQVLRLFENRIIGVSHIVRDHLQEQIGANGVCIYNPVSVKPYTRKSESSEPIIVYAATLSPRKNPEEAIDFVIRCMSENPYRYEVYGKGPLEGGLRERFAGQNKISWLSFSDDLPQVFSRSCVYVSSSLSEGLPLTPQLALICGCPCVLSDIPQHRELAELSRFVYLYQVGNLADFDRALKLALSSDREHAYLEGSRLAERVSPRAIASQLHDTFILGDANYENSF